MRAIKIGLLGCVGMTHVQALQANHRNVFHPSGRAASVQGFNGLGRARAEPRKLKPILRPAQTELEEKYDISAGRAASVQGSNELGRAQAEPRWQSLKRTDRIRSLPPLRSGSTPAPSRRLPSKRGALLN